MSSKKDINQLFSQAKELPVELTHDQIFNLINTISTIPNFKPWYHKLFSNIFFIVGGSSLIIFFTAFYFIENSNKPNSVDSKEIKLNEKKLTNTSLDSTINKNSSSGEIKLKNFTDPSIITPKVTQNPQTLNIEELNKIKRTFQLKKNEDEFDNNKVYKNLFTYRNQNILKPKRKISKQKELVPILKRGNGKTVNINTKTLRKMKKEIKSLIRKENILQKMPKLIVINIDDEFTLIVNEKRLNKKQYQLLASLLNNYKLKVFDNRKIVIGPVFILIGDFEKDGFRGSLQGLETKLLKSTTQKIIKEK